MESILLTYNEFSTKPNATSTPRTNHQPRVNFHSIESLATSSNISENQVRCIYSFSSSQVLGDTGYQTCSSSIINSENISPIQVKRIQSSKPRQKFYDWQNLYLKEYFSRNRYPTVKEQQTIANTILVPTASVRIWFQNQRARIGKHGRV